MSAEALRGLLKAQSDAHACETLSETELSKIVEKWPGHKPFFVLADMAAQSQREKCQKGRT
jgi:hypothetical protein